MLAAEEVVVTAICKTSGRMSRVNSHAADWVNGFVLPLVQMRFCFVRHYRPRASGLYRSNEIPGPSLGRPPKIRGSKALLRNLCFFVLRWAYIPARTRQNLSLSGQRPVVLRCRWALISPISPFVSSCFRNFPRRSRFRFQPGATSGIRCLIACPGRPGRPDQQHLGR